MIWSRRHLAYYKEIFQQLFYRFLKVNPNRVSIKGTLKRGPHFIPRIEIHFLDRNRNKIDWFYIVISFKDKLKHIYVSLVQSTDIRYRVDCEPVEQAIQLDAVKDFVNDFLDGTIRSRVERRNVIQCVLR